MGRQFVKEGVISIVRHPLVSLASITTIAMMLVIMGVFLIFSENANKIATSASQQPPVLIWVEYGVDESTVSDINNALKENTKIKNFTMQTPEENFKQFKADLGEDSDILDGFDPELLPYTFTVQLIDVSDIEKFKLDMEGIPGVRKVEYSQPVTEFFSNARRMVNYITLVAFIVLCGITLFIISNMVRIAVYSRAEEIGIMKYVGATNMYIRVPFIIEGSLVGLLGSAIANIVVLFGYSVIVDKSSLSQGGLSILQLVPVNEILVMTIIINVFIGVFIGAVGSAFSVRRYVRV